MTTPTNTTPGGAANNATFQTAGGGSPSGLVLDLSAVQQVNQTGAVESTATTAYRERMVPGSDEGLLQTFNPSNAGQYAAQVKDLDVGMLLVDLVRESRRQTRLLVRLFNTITDQHLDILELDDMESE